MGVIQKFFVASLFMWAIPIAILYAFNHNILPGKILNYLRFFCVVAILKWVLFCRIVLKFVCFIYSIY